MNSMGSAAEGYAAVRSAIETIRRVIKGHRLVAAANHGGAWRLAVGFDPVEDLSCNCYGFTNDSCFASLAS